MPRSTQAVFSFGAGVMSPSMEMRADSQRYERASRFMRNWMVTPQGGVIKRHGAEYIGEQKDAANGLGRIFPIFRGGNESDILMEMTEQSARFWLDDALLQASGGGDLEISHFAVWGMLPDVQFANQEKLGVAVHPDMPPYYITVNSDSDIVGEYLPFANIPQQIFQDAFAPTTVSTDFVYTLTFSPAWLDGETFLFSYNGKLNTTGNPWEPIELQYQYSSSPATMVANLERACEDNQYLGAGTSNVYTVQNTGTDVYTIQIVGPLSGRSMVLPPLAQSDRTVEITVGTNPGNRLEEPVWSFPYVVTHTPGTTYYQCIAPHSSSAATEPGTGADWTDVWIALPGKPEWFDWQHGLGNAWALNTLYGPWGRGFPRTVTFHEQRLFLGGTDSSFAGGLVANPTGAPGLPATIWGSGINEFRDFITGPNDADPVQFTLSTRGIPAISWMTSLQGLLVGTTAGHYRVSANITITPSSINVQKQNGARSAIDTPVTINNRVFSTQLGRTTVHSAAYQREALAVLVDDISIATPELFEGGVRFLSLMQVPEDVVYMVRNDGSIIGLSFNPETEVVAWWEWTTTGRFYDAEVIFNARTNEEELYMITTRGPSDTPAIEKVVYPLRDFSASNLDGYCWLDAFYRDTLTDSNLITGVPARLEGETVRVTVNDADLGEFVVTANTITLPENYTGYVYVGYSVTADMQTFERVEGNPQGVGFGTARRWNKLYARLISSALPKVNDQRVPDRTPASPMDLPEPLRNGDFRTHNLGYDDGSLTVEQDLPFPTHVVGLYGQIGTYDA